MPATNAVISENDLARRVEAFEDALTRDPAADLARFLPPAGNPEYMPLLAELVRVDLEHAWRSGRPRRLAAYRRFPAVFADSDVLAAVAFEEYRLRRRAGEHVVPSEYRSTFGIDTSDWPVVEASAEEDRLSRTRPGNDSVLRTKVVGVAPANAPSHSSEDDWSSRWSAAARTLPGPGATFAGFRLEEELGRGAFGRVYLARQGDLAARPVALKVACEIAHESQTLAQLQHTNIVPIYSFHRVGEFQAVCMPYFGRTTLGDVLETIAGEKGLPSSGRELKSTLAGRAQTTQPPQSTSAPLHQTPVPAAATPTPAPADGWARLEGLSYVEAVLWLGEQLADGLAHAHDRGILHRDLKPANVLLTNDGRPMLLDFNLSEDTKARNGAERASVGGTLPYMAPEHLEAFRGGKEPLDGRCDIFSLGVILFELLTGRHPYPVQARGKARDAIPAMIADRRAGVPLIRPINRTVSPAAEAIVRKCLAADRDERYQRAEHLREDLHRQLTHRPLRYASDPSVRERARKWARRHPRLSSSGAVAAVAAAVLIAIGATALYIHDRSRNLEARNQFADHRVAFDDAELFFQDRNQSRPRLDESHARLHNVLVRYEVPADGSTDDWLTSSKVVRLPDADRARLRAEVGEAFYLMAEVAVLNARAAEAGSSERADRLDAATRWHAAAERYAGERIPRAVRDQRDSLDRLRKGEPDRETDVVDIASDSPRDLFLLGSRLAQNGEHFRALPLLEKATRLDPTMFSAWFVQGTAHLSAAQPELAAAAFSACLAIRDDFAPAWLNRGVAFAELRWYERAVADYDRAIRLDPALTEAYVQRAFARIRLRDPLAAEADFTRALDTGAATARVYFLRADARARRGDEAGAAADRDTGLKLTPTDELSWVGRAEVRMATDPAAALGDVEAALKVNAFSVSALQLKAHLLAERLNRPGDALATVDRAVEFHPDHAALRAGRGVLLARLGKRAAAHDDARGALRRDTRPPNQYQVACIYALTSKTNFEDRAEAMRLLWESLKTGYGLDLVDGDTDLDLIRGDRAFREMLADARSLEQARAK